MKIVSIFLLGVGILVGAIILNTLASRIGLISWFEFLKDKYGVKNSKLTYLNKPQMFLTNIFRKKLCN